MDVLERRLKKGAERIERERGLPLSGEAIKAAVERFESELKARGYGNVLKGEAIGIRGNRFAKVAFDILADVLDVEKKDLFLYLILKPFLQIWENAPQAVKEYYRYKFKELDEVIEIAKSI